MRLLLTGSLCALLLAITSYASGAPPSNQTTSGTPTQNWDRVLPGNVRFTVLAEFNNEAVRDNETGLVWERAPEPNIWEWKDARQRCLIKNIGSRKGWRLPSLFELASLIDTTTGPITLAVGHPFINIDAATSPTAARFYWSSTVDSVGVDTAGNVTTAFWVDFALGVGEGSKTNGGHAWCVRGPGGLSVY